MSPSGHDLHCARRLRAALASAEPLLRAISDADSARHPAPGKWSPRQIIGHLIDSASNNHQRFVRAVWQDDLVFPGYSQEGWVALQRYHDAAWSELLDFWLAFNRHIAVVMCEIPDDVRLRVHSRHNLDEIAMRAPERAEEATLDYFMSDYVDHLEHHVRQILGAAWRPSGASEQAAYEELQCYTLALSDVAFIHQHVVDAWAAQHADDRTKPIALTFALVGLYLHLEKGFSGRQVQRAHMSLARHREQWPSFTLPSERGSVDASQVMAAPPGAERDQAIDAWCASVWDAFRDSHQAVADLLRKHGIA